MNIIKIITFSFLVSIIAACSEQKPNTQIGYIDGQYIYISSNVPGTLHQLPVSAGQEVKKGDLLLQLDLEPESSNVKAVAANIKQLEDQIDFFKKQLTRQQFLYEKKATSKINLEKAQIDYDNYVQQLAAAQANYIETQWTLDQKTLVAPSNGQIFDTFYQVGEKVMAYKPILSMLDPKTLRVIFYLPENKLPQISIGEKVEFSCDNCQGRNQATITYISSMAEYTPPVIYNKESRDKLVYLIRATLAAETASKFRPGQPVDIYINQE